MSSARLRLDQGRGVEGREILHPVFSRFTEGFGSTDVREARELLDQWFPELG